MSRIKIILLSLTVVLAVGVTTSSSAYASPVWLVKGKVLEFSSETSLATVTFGEMTIKWEDSSTKEKFEAKCKKASGEAELKGDEPGTDKLQAFKFKECSLVKAPEGCELTIGGVTSEELPGWPTTLETVGEKTYDVSTGISFSLTLEGCKKSSFSKTWLFRGTLKTEMKNEAGKVKMVLPVTAVEGDTLKSEGAEALLSGEGNLEEKGGGTLETMKGEREKCLVMPCYTTENGSLVTGSLKVDSKKTGGNGILKATLAGVKLTIECGEESGSGTIENSTVSKMGEGSISFHYLKCTVAAPAGQNCLVLGELVRYSSTKDLLLLLTPSAGYRDDFSPGSGTIFTTVLIDHCTTEALNGSFNLTGTMAAEVNNATSSLEFTSQSGSVLKFGGNAAEYLDTVQILMEGGGKIGVEKGS